MNPQFNSLFSPRMQTKGSISSHKYSTAHMAGFSHPQHFLLQDVFLPILDPSQLSIINYRKSLIYSNLQLT